jgi:glycosyltransferase involved in cell wall biosynthesis
MSLPRTLFVGKATAAIAWYRCALPAMALGLEWVGLAGAPPDAKVATGVTRKPFSLDDIYDCEVVVLQQPDGAWAPVIRRLQAQGTVVLFETDDYIQSVRKMRGHEAQRYWTKDRIAGIERTMRLADGIVCSTEYLARRYCAFNPHTWVCRNGIDLNRYAYERAPRRADVTIGWAGGIGHRGALEPWLPGVAAVMRERPQTRFMTVGQPFAGQLAPEFGEERAFGVPFSHLEMYPASMTAFDVALAPSGRTNLFRGKSDLRWLEASALGTPLIADPEVYPEIEHGVTGFHATSVDEMRELLVALVDDPALRARVGEQARAYVTEHRRIGVAAEQWAGVLREAVAARAVPAA